MAREYFNRGVARLRLRKIVEALRKMGPKEAGRIAVIESTLEISGWPFTQQRYREFCSRLLGYVPGESRVG